MPAFCLGEGGGDPQQPAHLPPVNTCTFRPPSSSPVTPHSNWAVMRGGDSLTSPAPHAPHTARGSLSAGAARRGTLRGSGHSLTCGKAPSIPRSRSPRRARRGRIAASGTCPPRRPAKRTAPTCGARAPRSRTCVDLGRQPTSHGAPRWLQPQLQSHFKSDCCFSEGSASALSYPPPSRGAPRTVSRNATGSKVSATNTCRDDSGPATLPSSWVRDLPRLDRRRGPQPQGAGRLAQLGEGLAGSSPGGGFAAEGQERIL